MPCRRYSSQKSFAACRLLGASLARTQPSSGPTEVFLVNGITYLNIICLYGISTGKRTHFVVGNTD